MATRICLDCPADISHRGCLAKRCKPCVKNHAKRPRPQSGTPAYRESLRKAQLMCLECDTTLFVAHGRRKRCRSCVEKRHSRKVRLCLDCRIDISYRDMDKTRCSPCATIHRRSSKQAPRLCASCKKNISHRDGRAKRCKPCAGKHARALQREYSQERKRAADRAKRAADLQAKRDAAAAGRAERVAAAKAKRAADAADAAAKKAASKEKADSYLRVRYRAIRFCPDCGLNVSHRPQSEELCLFCQRLRDAPRQYCVGCETDITEQERSLPRCDDCHDEHLFDRYIARLERLREAKTVETAPSWLEHTVKIGELSMLLDTRKATREKRQKVAANALSGE